MAVKTHRFKGVKYYVELDEPYEGWCDRPKTPDPREYPAIRIPAGLKAGNSRAAREGLIILIHECLHAENWDKSEKKVDEAACDIGSLLWRLGYRRIKNIRKL